MCHGESWQKGEEEEVDDLHDVDKDQEAASSLEGYEDLESVWQKSCFFFFFFFFNCWEADGEDMGRSFTIYRIWEIFWHSSFICGALFPFPRTLSAIADNPRSTA